MYSTVFIASTPRGYPRTKDDFERMLRGRNAGRLGLVRYVDSGRFGMRIGLGLPAGRSEGRC
jgi:hypothetical protein